MYSASATGHNFSQKSEGSYESRKGVFYCATKAKRGFILPGSYSQVLVEPLEDLWKLPAKRAWEYQRLNYVKANDGDTKAELIWNEFSRVWSPWLIRQNVSFTVCLKDLLNFDNLHYSLSDPTTKWRVGTYYSNLCLDSHQMFCKKDISRPDKATDRQLSSPLKSLLACREKSRWVAWFTSIFCALREVMKSPSQV